jgi:hypothetical protein
MLISLQQAWILSTQARRRNYAYRSSTGQGREHALARLRGLVGYETDLQPVRVSGPRIESADVTELQEMLYSAMRRHALTVNSGKFDVLQDSTVDYSTNWKLRATGGG